MQLLVRMHSCFCRVRLVGIGCCMCEAMMSAADFKNVSIVAHYIKERTRDAQFVVISLRNNMFELANRLVGIYKTDNATKSVSINPGSFVVGSSAQAPPLLRGPVLVA